MKEFDPGEMPSIASITDKVRQLAIGMPATSIHFLGDIAVFVGAEENAALVNEAGEVSTVAIHGGAVLCAAEDDLLLVSAAAQSIRFHASDEAMRPMGRARICG